MVLKPFCSSCRHSIRITAILRLIAVLAMVGWTEFFQTAPALAHEKDHWETAADVELSDMGVSQLGKLYQMFDKKFKAYDHEGAQVVVAGDVKWCAIDGDTLKGIRNSPKNFGRCVEKLLLTSILEESETRKNLEQEMSFLTPQGTFRGAYSKVFGVNKNSSDEALEQMNHLVRSCVKSGVPFEDLSYMFVYGDCRANGVSCPLTALKTKDCIIPKGLSTVEICGQNEACFNHGRSLILWGYFPWFATYQSPALLEDFLNGLDIIVARWNKNVPVQKPKTVDVKKPQEKTANGPVALKTTHIRLKQPKPVIPEKGNELPGEQTPVSASGKGADLPGEQTPTSGGNSSQEAAGVSAPPPLIKPKSTDPKLDSRISAIQTGNTGKASKLNCSDENIQKNRAKLEEKVPDRIENFNDFKISQNRLSAEVEIYICGIYKYYQEKEKKENETKSSIQPQPLASDQDLENPPQPTVPPVPTIPLIPSVLISTSKNMMDLGSMISVRASAINKARAKLYLSDQKKPARKREGFEDPGSPNLVEAFHQIMHEGRFSAALATMGSNLDLIRTEDESKDAADSIWGAEGETASETFKKFETFIQNSYAEKFGTEKITYSSDVNLLAKIKAAADSPKIYLLLKETGDWRNNTLKAGLKPWLEKIKEKHPEWMNDFPSSVVGIL